MFDGCRRHRANLWHCGHASRVRRQRSSAHRRGGHQRPRHRPHQRLPGTTQCGSRLPGRSRPERAGPEIEGLGGEGSRPLQLQGRHRPASGVGGQESGRHLHRRPEPLALANDHLGGSGRQACLRREADESRHCRRPRGLGSAEEIQRCGPARHPESQQRGQRGFAPGDSRGEVWQAEDLLWLRLQSAQRHRLQGALRSPVQSGLEPVARPGGHRPVPRQPGALQLALVLGHRQRRTEQPRHAPVGYGVLGAGSERDPSAAGDGHRRTVQVGRQSN